MKKFVLAAVAFIASLGAAQAQDLFSKGESALNIGIGIGHSYGGYGVSIPPLSVAYDYSLVSNLINGNNGAITLGAYGAYTSTSYRYDGFGSITGSHTVIGARGMFHYLCICVLKAWKNCCTNSCTAMNTKTDTMPSLKSQTKKQKLKARSAQISSSPPKSSLSRWALLRNPTTT